jgi:transposase-like protein
MAKQRRSIEFKTKVVLEALKEQRTLNEIAGEYQINPVQIGRWKKEAIAALPMVFTGDQKLKAQIDELKSQLRESQSIIGQRVIEIEFLKKKLSL